MCQCPQRAIFISTVCLYIKHRPFIRCVNALSGLFSFLPMLSVWDGFSPNNTCVNALSGLFSFLHDRKISGKHDEISRGVNALSGLFSFLQKQQGGFKKMSELCQCPQRAIFISTLLEKDSHVEGGVMCQCPQRAIFISTVPSGNPHKHWLSSLIFAGICLNILNSTVFPSFSGLFIICSYLAILFFPRSLQILYFIICFS